MTPEPHTACSACGRRLDEPTNLDPAERTPCPDCGSLSRLVSVYASDSIAIHERVGVVQKRPGFRGESGRRRPIKEIITGDEQTADGQWVEKTRVIDREADTYEETVRDAEGKLLHHQTEPLSEHLGHGSDRECKRGPKSQQPSSALQHDVPRFRPAPPRPNPKPPSHPNGR